MPRMLTLDVNYLAGTISFKNVKTATVTFRSADGTPRLFDKAPHLGFTMAGLSSGVLYTVSWVKSGSRFAGFVLGFKTALTADVEWQAQERA